MEAADVKLFLGKTFASQHALLHKQEDVSKYSLVSQSLICLSELNQGCATYKYTTF